MLKSARTFDAGRIMMQPPPLSVKMHSSSDASVRQKVSLKRSIGQQVAKMMQWGDDILDIANTMNTESEKKRRTDEPSKNGEKDEKSRAAHFREAYSCPFLPGLYDENNPIVSDLASRRKEKDLKRFVRSRVLLSFTFYCTRMKT